MRISSEHKRDFAPATNAVKKPATRATRSQSAAPSHSAPQSVDAFVTPRPEARAEAANVRLQGSAADRADYKKIRHFLMQSATGRAALQYIDKHDLKVKYHSGGGSFWDGKEIVLDRRQSFRNTALTLVHEVEHAKTDLRGTSPNFDRIHKLSRREFVRQAIIEEVRGTVRSIDAKRELQQKGVNTGDAQFPLEHQYDVAYDRAVSAYHAKHPNASQSRLDAVGRRAGRARVQRGFFDGEVRTSTTHQSYVKYYGHAWDVAHGRG